MNFEISFFSSSQDFLTEARAELERREDSESLMLGLAEGWARLNQEVRAWTVRRSGSIALLAFQKPPHHLILSPAPDLSPVEFLAGEIAKRPEVVFPGVVGPVHETETFTRVFGERTGQRFRVGYRQRIHRADAASDPRRTPGRLIVADESHLDLCMRWGHEFTLEAIPNEAMTPEQLRENTLARLRRGTLFLWEHDGKIAAMTGISRPTRNGVSVNSVYAPPEMRGRGYASALVAAVTEKQLREGKKFCVLYTDLANATSNSIYARVGYRAIADAVNFLKI